MEVSLLPLSFDEFNLENLKNFSVIKVSNK
jgi:hypothetical protein